MASDGSISGPARQNISRSIVALFKQHFGRGPTSARTYVNDDVITVVLQDMLTPAEKTLADNDKAPVVNDIREAFQTAICDEAVALIEGETNRNVKVLLSDHCVAPDYGIQCFILEPLDLEDATPCDDLADQESDS